METIKYFNWCQSFVLPTLGAALQENAMLATHHVNTNDTDMPGHRGVESHRIAYNAAFEELGLNWHWDAVTYALLPAQGPAGVRHYLEHEHQHLLRAYDADFLVQAIEAAKQRCHRLLA